MFIYDGFMSNMITKNIVDLWFHICLLKWFCHVFYLWLVLKDGFLSCTVGSIRHLKVVVNHVRWFYDGGVECLIYIYLQWLDSCPMVWVHLVACMLFASVVVDCLYSGFLRFWRMVLYVGWLCHVLVCFKWFGLWSLLKAGSSYQRGDRDPEDLEHQ